MATVSEYLVKLEKLTETNLDILKAINESFLTRKDHLSVSIGDSIYNIPSFLSLENKINYLQENLYNLIHAPESGEAYFTMDGNSRAIEVRGYTHTPNRFILPTVETFGVKSNDIFKDFLTPMPYIHFEFKELPNDITTVNVKKVIPLNSSLLSTLRGFMSYTEENEVGVYDVERASTQIEYADVYKILAGYTKGEDYIEYDTVQSLPIRKNIGSGTFVIEEIVKDEVDENLDNYITLKLRNDLPDYRTRLSYRLFDETIDKDLQVGDQLVTFDDSAKMQITEIRSISNTITIKVLHGEYLNLVPYKGDGKNVPDLAKIRFYSPVDFDADKYVDIPLEEDQYIFVAVAALNSRMNVQGPWGSGLLLNTYKLTKDNIEGQEFNEYYKENVNNVGDVLYEICSIMSNTISKYSGEQFRHFATAQPVIDPNNLVVVQINKHLNDSTSVQNIRRYYADKKNYQTELNNTQAQIDNINNQLGSISFDDTSDLRTIYTSQLQELNARKNELTASVTKTMELIAYEANHADVPIENAKYHIRGFLDIEDFITQYNLDYLRDHIIGVRVQYRYKNVDQEQGNAISISDKFVFSDWNDAPYLLRNRVPSWPENAGGFRFTLEEDNSLMNEPSFNQIDIPISQGETVDIRVRLIYDLGYPFITTTSAWSEIYNMAFPEEFTKDVQVLTIIAENNDDIETNRFNNILRQGGVNEHVEDRVTDQDLTYFHKPESIASGFYTDERRVIPLADKLREMYNSIVALQDEIFNTSSDQLEVRLVNGDVISPMKANQLNNFSVAAADQFANDLENAIAEGAYTYDGDTGMVSVILNISLHNPSNRTIRLYSMFAGDTGLPVSGITKGGVTKSMFNPDNYQAGDKLGVWIKNQSGENEGDDLFLQTCNQFMYFRLNNPYDNTSYYFDSTQIFDDDDELSLRKDAISIEDYVTTHGASNTKLAAMYPIVTNKESLLIGKDPAPDAYMVISPESSIMVPIIFEYKLNPQANDSISKTMSFDIRTSIYKDPINYTFRITAKSQATMQDKLTTTNRKKTSGAYSGDNQTLTKYNSTVLV